MLNFQPGPLSNCEHIFNINDSGVQLKLTSIKTDGFHELFRVSLCITSAALRKKEVRGLQFSVRTSGLGQVHVFLPPDDS